MMGTLSACGSDARARLDARLRAMVELHFDPMDGAAFWVDRAKALGITPRAEIDCIESLPLLGEMDASDLRARPLLDYIPRRFHGRMSEFTIAQTGGTTTGAAGGFGAWTAYRQDELLAAFVEPFVSAATALGFPRGQGWLFVGPSGPHVIGKVVPHLARELGSAEPFCVDFDPRWANRLTPGSFARARYRTHVIDQAMAIVDRQDVTVLFTTPPVLHAMAERMTDRQRESIRAVHYGGVAIAPETMRQFQQSTFPRAVHLSGYGNTLFGCCLELSTKLGRAIDYFPHGERLLLEVVDDGGEPVAPGESGRVRFTRLDESMLIVRMIERDVAQSIRCPAGAPRGFHLPGVRDPHTPASTPSGVADPLY
jgi:thienamycin biosynthesis protein ThnN